MERDQKGGDELTRRVMEKTLEPLQMRFTEIEFVRDSLVVQESVLFVRRVKEVVHDLEEHNLVYPCEMTSIESMSDGLGFELVGRYWTVEKENVVDVSMRVVLPLDPTKELSFEMKNMKGLDKWMKIR